jgi:hypothetical protein
MRFAAKVVLLALLGCAAALLVACGDRSGLLSEEDAGSLQDALATAQAACADGDTARAQLAADRFAQRVEALPPGAVDRRLVANLRDGAAKLGALVATTCMETTDPTTTTTPTVTTTTPTVTTTTTPTVTTAPTTPTEPPPTTPPTTTTPPDTGGGATPPGDSGGAPGPSTGGVPPGLAKKGSAAKDEGAK